jgi:hypothetical protein
VRAHPPRRPGAIAALLASLAGAAHAHVGPVLPSTCTFDPVTLAVVGTTTPGTAAPAGAADAFRVRYDLERSEAQFCQADPADPENACAPPVARVFTLGATAGSLTLPAIFPASLWATGDIVTAAMPVVLTLGASTATVPLALTTGLVGTADAVLAGTPADDGGSFALVGLVTAPAGAPAPLAGATLALTLACTATPPPDLDQFGLTTYTARLAGKLTASSARLQVVFEPLVASDPVTPDFSEPFRLRLAVGGADAATLVVAGGLAKHGHAWTGTADGGAGQVEIRPAARRPVATYVMAVRLDHVTVTVPSAGTVPLALTYDVGGVLSRGAADFRVRSGGRLVGR